MESFRSIFVCLVGAGLVRGLVTVIVRFWLFYRFGWEFIVRF